MKHVLHNDNVGIIDKVASQIRPDRHGHLYPTLVVALADGNCALSLLWFGDEQHHNEIRCRIVIDLASHSLPLP